MSGGKFAGSVFSKKRFWAPLFWFIILVGGVAFGSLSSSPEIIAGSILAGFLGLNESRRTAYKTNLIIAVVAAIIGALCGVMSRFQTVSLFFLLFVTGGFMLYFRDGERRFLPFAAALAKSVSKEETVEGLASAVSVKLREGGYRGHIFLAVTDGVLGLYLPECQGRKERRLRRNGGALWRVFASGRPYITGRVIPSRDLPLNRDAYSMISAPLLFENDKIGVLQLESEDTNSFTEDDLSKLEIIAFTASCKLGSLLQKADDAAELERFKGEVEAKLRAENAAARKRAEAEKRAKAEKEAKEAETESKKHGENGAEDQSSNGAGKSAGNEKSGGDENLNGDENNGGRPKRSEGLAEDTERNI